MTYEEFKGLVVNEIKGYLPEDYKDANITINHVVKNNETLDGLVIQRPGQNVSPTLYLEDFYKSLENGKDMEDILEKIAELRVSTDTPDLLDELELKPEDLTNYSMVKDHLIAHVIGVKGNEALLEKRPHVIKEDMAIMYKYAINDEMSVPITNELFKSYEVSIEEFHETAMSNISDSVTVTSLAATIMGMGVVEELNVPPEKDMLIVSNETKANGAIAIFDTDVMDRLSEKYGNVLILPSSIHEALVVPEAAGLSVNEAITMVTEVNATQVDPRDKLTDSVYRYDKETKEIIRCVDDIEIVHEKEVALAEEKELYKDERILVTETTETIKISNLLDTDIEVYGENFADALDLAKDDSVIVLNGKEEVQWKNTDRGFTGEVLSALKKDIRENSLRAEDHTERSEIAIKREEQVLALV